jgi:hypothetical protein
MPFIGKQPEVGAYSKLDAITTSATATYNLTLGGGAYYPSSANHLLVSLNGVMQAPQDSFTVSGSTIVFASTLASTDSIDFIMALGDVLDIGTPSDGTVTSAKLSGALTTPSTLAVGGNATVSGNMTVNTTAGQLDIEALGGGSVAVKSNGSLKISSGGSGALDLLHGTTEVLNTLSTGVSAPLGVHLGGTGTANRIDDYEVGTWTPTITGYGGGNTQTYSAQVGKYTKLGNLVIAQFRVRLSAKGNISGNYTFIGGIPFNHSGSDAGSATMSYWWSINGNNGTVQGEMGGATPNVVWPTYLSGTANNGTSYMNTSLLTNTTGFQGTLIYQIL